MYFDLLLRNRKGSGMVLALCSLVLISGLGLSYLMLGTGSIITSKREYARDKALDVAEAGIQKAISYLRGAAPNGTTDGSWRTDSLTESLDGDPNQQYTISVANFTGNPKKIVVMSVSSVIEGDATASRTVKVVLQRDAENVSPWNNVIFGGVGQAGRSINGNVVMRGSIHLLGDGEPYTDTDGDGHWDDSEYYWDWNHDGHYDLGEPYTDVDHDGHRDAREPFSDINGNGTRDPALTVTDLAEEISGNADVGNNYNGMSSTLRSKLPAPPTVLFGGEVVDSLSAKLRVKNGRVNVSGSAVVGYANAAGNGQKETLDGSYVSDGYGGNKGTAGVNADNGYSHAYDLGEGIVKFPALSDPYPGYATYQDYLKANSYVVPAGDLVISSGASFTKSDASGNNSISCDGYGRLTIKGIVYVQGNIYFTGGTHSDINYVGSGTLVSTGDIAVNCNVLPNTGFPLTDRLGLIAAHNMSIGTSSQLTLALAAYAQYQISMGKQSEIAGTAVCSYFSMTNVPHIYQVPALADNLPPGMPGSSPIWVVNITIKSWAETAGSAGTH